MRVVISQPMFFPWPGFLEQVCLADVFVHYNDVQFSKGSFTNRVQVKTAKGSHWLSVPLTGLSLGQLIAEVRPDHRTDWRTRHRALLEQAYAAAPYRTEMLALLDQVYASDCDSIAKIGDLSLKVLCEYFGLARNTRFVGIEELGIGGAGSERVLAIVRALGGSHYVTGLGARNYLDHQAFERAGIQVEYMNYSKSSYPQLHGDFTPFVSSLDLVANCGRQGAELIQPSTLPWREFVKDE
ncbi:WbqC family protein [Metapseudomonas lalkuanensis]|uniref:WbqC family protein n=2 Tax=Metapseudomonas lalkuanensis TaxID=2604832 RepID=A0A5J6QN87_9GAMM|nr:WbqC family protein [Pseudomonas lalkuanensis]